MTQLTIQRKRMKYMRIRINADGTVSVSAPKYVSQAEITRFVESKKDRITEKQKMFEQRKKEYAPHLDDHQILLHGEIYTIIHPSAIHPSQWHTTVAQKSSKNKKNMIDHEHKQIITDTQLHTKAHQEQRYKTYAKAYLFGRLQEIAEFHELSYNKLYLRSAKTNRWTCSSTKNIWLNRKLVKMPRDISDYVICHELAHLLEMNHSKEFWRVVDTLYGNRKAAIQWLKKYGMSVQ